MWIASPWRVTSSWSSVLSGDFAWHSVSRNVVKRACRSAVRGLMHRLRIETARPPPGPADVEREIGAGVDDAIKVVPLERGNRASKSSATMSADSTAIGCGPQMRVQPVAENGRAQKTWQCRNARPAPARARRIGAARAIYPHRLAHIALTGVSSAP